MASELNETGGMWIDDTTICHGFLVGWGFCLQRSTSMSREFLLLATLHHFFCTSQQILWRIPRSPSHTYNSLPSLSTVPNILSLLPPPHCFIALVFLGIHRLRTLYFSPFEHASYFILLFTQLCHLSSPHHCVSGEPDMIPSGLPPRLLRVPQHAHHLYPHRLLRPRLTLHR